MVLEVGAGTAGSFDGMRCGLVDTRVTDKTIMDRFWPGWVYHTTDKEPEQVDTIPELAKKLGLDLSELENIVKEFNAASNKNEFNLMKLDGKATTGLKPNKTNWANPIDTPSYSRYPMTANLTFAYGRVKTNRFWAQTMCQCLDCMRLEN